MTGTRAVRIGGVTIGGGAPLALIGGPCAIENEKHAVMMAERLQRVTAEARVPFIYKSSYDKANRSSIHSYRGPGLTEGLRRIEDVTLLYGLSQLLLAIIFILVIIFRPEGLMGQREIALDRLFMKGGGAQPERTPASPQ